MTGNTSTHTASPFLYVSPFESTKLLYPQKAPSKELQEKLEREYKKGSIIELPNEGNTTDSREYDEYDEKFEPKVQKRQSHLLFLSVLVL